MYAYLFFGLSLLGIFSIFENFKGGQKLSFFKINVIVFLSLITIASGFDFLYELGYDYNVVRAFIRIFGFFAFTNLYYLVALHKIPKAVKYIEISLIIIYSIGFMKGFRLISIYKGQFTNNITFFNKLHFVLLFGFVIFSMIYNLYVIHKRT